ncbi:Tudor domain-containing protein 7A, partial [Oryzias melastigma]
KSPVRVSLSLRGEHPPEKAGFPDAKDYLKSIPSVVKLEYRMGEMMCFACVCEATAHIAELVARQKSPKKPARFKNVRYGLKGKPPDPYLPNGMQQATPPAGMQQATPPAGIAAGHFPRRDAAGRSHQSSPYVEAEVQNKIKQLLKKYCCGLWMSKLSGVYKEMFQQELHPQVLTDLQKWTDVCIVERATFKNPPDFLIYPLLVSQLKTMNNPLFVNVLYQDVCVSNVCPDGTLYCQLPSPDSLRLAKILEEINASVVSQISRMFGERVMEVLFIDFAVPATVKLTDLREVPPSVSEGMCLSIPPQILKLDESKGDRVAHIHLFVGGDGPQNSINLQLVQSKLFAESPEQPWKPHRCRPRRFLDLPVLKRTFSDPTLNCLCGPVTAVKSQPGQNMDVFVVVACHPGYFVMQPWRDMDKLESLMWRMFIYYSQKEESSTLMNVQKGDVCAAKINQQWHRVQVKRVLANGFVSVYELDYGQQELVPKSLIQPLVEPFRQLSFQAVPAQLAGVTQCQWGLQQRACCSPEPRGAARPGAQVESLSGCGRGGQEIDLWRPQADVYLVDTTLEDEDLWIHCIIAEWSAARGCKAP